MTWHPFVLIACLASPAFGETVKITSGEHDGFTRLVLDYGHPVDWQVGRSADGYQLRLVGEAATYDVTAAFNLIGKSRLAAIWAAPDTGDLSIGLACACHAIPFEFRPGTVVIDLKDGPPPKGSSFESAFEGGPLAPLTSVAPVRPRARPDNLPPAPKGGGDGYDWTKATQDTATDEAPIGDALNLRDPELQPLRTAILQEMAQGATQGVVNMAVPNGQYLGLISAGFPAAQIRIGPASTSVNQPDGSLHGDLGAQGRTCIAPEILNLAAWGDQSLAMADQMASMRNSLSGEFDKPEPGAIARAVKFQLYLGFGAEARQMISAFDQTQGDPLVWNALGHLIDDQSDPQGIFSGQASCAGPAALWSFLANPKAVKGDPLDKGAIRLAFSDLPIHLRRLLGPRLVDRFLAIDDQGSARAVRDAITRAPGDPGSSVKLMEADINLNAGDPASAEVIAQAVINDPGPDQAEALITLVEARIAQQLPMTPDTALAIRSHLDSNAGTAIEPRLQDALILAEAASGNFSAAFDSLKEHPSRMADVWALLVRLAPDEAFLTYSVIEPTTVAPDIPPETATAIARRLTELGLGNPALRWLSDVKDVDPLLLAETALNRNDGRGALTPLANIVGPSGQEMRLRALDLLGENILRADILEKLGDLPAASAALARAENWDRLALSGEGPWKDLAVRLGETPASAISEGGLPYGPLARGQDLAKAAAETRASIDSLLTAVPRPKMNAP